MVARASRTERGRGDADGSRDCQRRPGPAAEGDVESFGIPAQRDRNHARECRMRAIRSNAWATGIAALLCSTSWIATVAEGASIVLPAENVNLAPSPHPGYALATQK